MLKHLTKNILYLPSSPETDRPALAYIAGNSAALMVDAGNSPAHARLFLSALKQKGLALPDYVALTHWHWDHCFGLSALSALSLCSSQTDAKLKEMALWKWDDASMAQRLASGKEIPFCDENIRKEYLNREEIQVRSANLAFSEKLSLNLGGITARLLPLPNSHAEGSLAVFIPEERALILGDIICMDYYGSNPPAHHPEKLARMIEEMEEALDFCIALYGHDEPATDTKQALLKYLKEELAACKA